ncbi:MAG: hypothetical protein JWN70_3410, partial [Planctomycetaceae bacterium]|nr:hypothetical protein [Planctomycetaceae bacterium]
MDPALPITPAGRFNQGLQVDQVPTSLRYRARAGSSVRIRATWSMGPALPITPAGRFNQGPRVNQVPTSSRYRARAGDRPGRDG